MPGYREFRRLLRDHDREAPVPVHDADG
jgi:hypothetical protein